MHVNALWYILFTKLVVECANIYLAVQVQTETLLVNMDEGPCVVLPTAADSFVHNHVQGAAAAEQVKDFKQGTVWKLLVGSYETLRKFAHELEGCCDLLVCDEGHRLKASGGNKTITALLQLGCHRRIILTGTPVQNNMAEFYGKFACSGWLCSSYDVGMSPQWQHLARYFIAPDSWQLKLPAWHGQ